MKQSDTFNDWLAAREVELVEMEQRLKKWWEKVERIPYEQKQEFMSQDPEISGLDQRLEGLLEIMAKIYLEATPEERSEIRKAFDGKDCVWKGMLDFPGRMSEKVKSKKDLRPLRLGLTVASMVDGRWDVRDLMLGLDDLYRAAQRVGINPDRHFKTIGKISSQQESASGWGNTHDLLCSYYQRFNGKKKKKN